MNVCVISKWDCAGGAPQATYRLFRALQKHVRVTYLVNKKTIKDKNIHNITSYERQKKSYYESLIQKNYIDCNRTAVSNTYFTVTSNGADLRSNQYIHEADVINLHWVEKFLSLESINYLASLGKPIVWTLHDERPYTGGCHYTAGCKEFSENHCLSCRQLIADECALPNAVLICKEDIVKNTNMTVVCPSNWIAQEASKSSVFSGKKIEVIPNAVDTGVYYPRSQADVRDRLGVSQEAFVILAGSTDNNEIRKGYKYYIETLNYCLKNNQFLDKSRNKQIVVITFGVKTDSEMHKKIMHLDIGYISDENIMAEIYSAADIYVLTTLEDNLPNTVLESMACGTPVVGFNTGGLCDMVVNGVNGILVPTSNAQALSESVLMLLQYPEKHREYGRSALQTVRTGFTQALQSERYLELFSGLKTIESKYAAIDESSIYSCSLKKASRENLLYRAGVLIRWILRRFYLVRV